MDKQTFEVDVHREPDGYWAQVRGLEGCFASGRTIDELVTAPHETIAMYLSDTEPQRTLTRLTGRLEIEPDLRPASSDDITQPASRRTRQPHRDDRPPNTRS